MPIPGPPSSSAIRTERLLLRRPELPDVTPIFEIHSDPLTSRFNPAGPHRTTDDSRAVLEAWLVHWNQHGFGPWMVEELGAPGISIGCAGLRWRGAHELPGLNLYFRFRPSAWGRGYATEAARAAIQFGLTVADEVTAIINESNEASIRVAERSNMTLVGPIELHGRPARLYAYPARESRPG